jgi:hypothetical protein
MIVFCITLSIYKRIRSPEAIGIGGAGGVYPAQKLSLPRSSKDPTVSIVRPPKFQLYRKSNLVPEPILTKIVLTHL